MEVQKRNGVSIYCLSSGPQLPEWLGEQARRNLSKRDEAVRRRIELIQDFQMPASSSKLVQSADGRYIIAAGTYAPRIRCYDVHELSMKFERYLDAEVVDMVLLGEDYGKIAILREDRTIDFHAPYGAHESIRIPAFGRGMAYEPTTCELLVAAKGNQVFRINLEEGRFSEPWSFLLPSSSSSSSVSATCIAVDRSHPLASIGCDDGIVRFWDNRSPETLTPFLKLDVQSATVGRGYADPQNQNPGEITAMAHDPSGLYICAGTGGGLVALYDVRSSQPLHVCEHKHGLPIHTIKFHSGSGLVLSSDEKLVKAWRYRSGGDGFVRSSGGAAGERNGHNGKESKGLGSVEVNIEGTGKLSHFIVAGDEKDPCGDRSGIILCATNQPKMESYYVPSIGVAPKWCSYLEGITEELEERDLQRQGQDGGGADVVQEGLETIYENYKFVSRDDIEKLGISNLIGTPLLRGYMHGFFMDHNFYNRVKAVANPFEYEQYQKKKLKERLDAKSSSRIAPRASANQKTKVNAELAERLQVKAGDTTKAGKLASKVLTDDRFGNLFTNQDFAINEQDENFKLRNPSGVAAAKHKLNNLDSDNSDNDDDDDDDKVGATTRLINDEASLASSSEDSSDDDESEDGFKGAKVRGEAYDEVKRRKSKTKAAKSTRKKPKVSLQDAEELGGKEALSLGLDDPSAASQQARRRLEEMNMPLSKRFALQQQQDDKPVVRVTGGAKEATFVPRDKKRMAEEAKKKQSSRPRGGGAKRERRGVKELRLKKPYDRKVK